jgi:hypothetical protein
VSHVYVNSKKRAASIQRATERREREALAPRLLHSCPELRSLRIHIEDRFALAVTKHVRHVMVDRAPAYFVIACGDETCDSTGHDITHEVMAALRMKSAVFTSEHPCEGNVGKAICTRTIYFTVTAEFASS